MSIALFLVHFSSIFHSVSSFCYNKYTYNYAIEGFDIPSIDFIKYREQNHKQFVFKIP